MACLLIDGLGREVSLVETPRRVVSLVPSLTEALFEFGLDDHVVGVTRFCVEPRAKTAAKPKVGGTKDVDINAVLGLMPDLVIASAEENRREDVEPIIEAGIPVYVSLPHTARGAVELLRDLAELTGAGTRAEAVVAEADRAVAEITAETARAARRPRVFVPIWRRPYMTVSRDTYVHDCLAICGGDNVFSDRSERYPIVTLEEMAAMDPEVIILPSEPYRFGRRHLTEFASCSQVTAVRSGRVHLVDGRMLTWYGPRIASSLRAIAVLLRTE